jgi:hypothetical protein
MMKRKKAANSIEEAVDKAAAVLELERKLSGRLKFMAYLFFALTLASLLFALFAQEEKHAVPLQREENSILMDIEAISGAALFSDRESLELSIQDVLNFYVVSLIFASIGIYLFHFSSKNSRSGSKMQLRTENEPPPPANP